MALQISEAHYPPPRGALQQKTRRAKGQRRRIGEEWLLVFACFAPYDSTMFLGVSLNNDWEWGIPLVWEKDRQESVIENFTSYATRIGPLPGGFKFRVDQFY